MLESISKTAQEEKLLVLCQSSLGDLGFRVVDLECKLGPRSIVRIFIDHEQEKKKGISLEDCTKATRAIEPVLEEKEQEVGLPGAYDLEVSSPGLDRRLRLKSDFEQELGATVKLKLKKGAGLGSSLRGELFEVDSDAIIVAADGRKVRVPFESIVRATRLWVEGN